MIYVLVYSNHGSLDSRGSPGVVKTDMAVRDATKGKKTFFPVR